MLTAGIDVGNKFTKVVLLNNGDVVAYGYAPSEFDHEKAAGAALSQALHEAGLQRKDLDLILATGAGKTKITFTENTISEIAAAARGAMHLFPAARTVIDVGAEEGRALNMNAAGKIIDFALNEKCAAGAGSFVETISVALNVTPEEMGLLALKSNKAVPINAQCAVFAESEVISLIHARTPKEDISRSILESMARRISSLARRAGLKKEVVMIGGLAKNPAFIQALEKELGVRILLPANPEFVCALGAALAAVEKTG